MSGYYLTAEPVGVCSCHDCTCGGLCSDCRRERALERDDYDGDDE